MTESGKLSPEDRMIVAILSATDISAPPQRDAPWLVRQGKRQLRRRRITQGALAGIGTIALIMSAISLGPDLGQEQGAVVAQADGEAVEPFGTGRLPVCFYKPDKSAIVYWIVFPDGYQIVDSLQEAIDRCAYGWRRGYIQPGGHDALRHSNSEATLPVPELFACAYDVPRDSRLPGTTNAEAAIFPVVDGRPSTCKDLGLRPLA